MATRKRTSAGGRKGIARKGKSRKGNGRAHSTTSMSWADRWHGKSLMGHAKTHPYASAAIAAAAAGTGALIWSRMGNNREQDLSAMAI